MPPSRAPTLPRVSPRRCGTAPSSSSMVACATRSSSPGSSARRRFPSFASSYVDTTLQTWSLTPRLSVKNPILGMPSNILTGIDYYDASYHSNRSEFNGLAPIHSYDLKQQTLAGYWQQTVGLLPTTDFSYGARAQNTMLRARD